MSFIYENFTLYRRSPVWILHQFDLDDSEKSINKQYLMYRAYDKIVEPEKPQNVWDGSGINCEKIMLDDGNTYWALVCRGGWFEIRLREEYNYHKLYEVQYDYANPGIGELRVFFNETLAEITKGPSGWLSSLPHKSLDGIYIKCRQRNFGLSDPPPRGEIDNLRVYYYEPIGELAKYTPLKTSTAPTAIATLRGPTAFQTTKYMGAENTMTMRFYTEAEHTDFVLHADRPHVLCDEKATLYRGVVELGECRYYGSELYEHDITFRSSNKLGEGWV